MDTYFDNKPGALAILCCDAAIELDNHIRGRGMGLGSVDEFCHVLKKYVPADSESSFAFPYHAIWYSVGAGSDKKIRYMDELAFEMHLLAMELEEVRGQPKQKLEELRDFFVSASNEFMRYDYDMRIHEI